MTLPCGTPNFDTNSWLDILTIFALVCPLPRYESNYSSKDRLTPAFCNQNVWYNKRYQKPLSELDMLQLAQFFPILIISPTIAVVKYLCDSATYIKQQPPLPFRLKLFSTPPLLQFFLALSYLSLFNELCNILMKIE